MTPGRIAEIGKLADRARDATPPLASARGEFEVHIPYRDVRDLLADFARFRALLPSCLGAWTGGSGGHRVYEGGCSNPGMWDVGVGFVCDDHRNPNGGDDDAWEWPTERDRLRALLPSETERAALESMLQDDSGWSATRDAFVRRLLAGTATAWSCPVASQECLIRKTCTNKCGRLDPPAVDSPQIATGAARAMELPPFVEAWKRYKERGYDYNGDALARVEFGYNIAVETLGMVAK